MANFADYLKKADLDSEINEAQKQTEDRRESAGNPESIPERFRNKSAEEIANSYVELEKKFSQQGNDLGQMRKTLDEFIRLQSEVSAKPSAEETAASPKTIDDLYKDTEGTIKEVVDKAAGERLKKVEEELAAKRLQDELDTITRDFPTWRKDTQDAAFVEWVQKDPIRLQTAILASEHNNTAAARSLIGTWYEVQAARKQAEQQQRDTQLRSATGLEGSGGSYGGTEQVFSRRALMEKRIAAKRGDDSARQYLIDNRDAIAIAYEEGRVKD